MGRGRAEGFKGWVGREGEIGENEGEVKERVV